MAEPGADGVDVDAGAQEMNGRCMPNSVWAYALGGQRRYRLARQIGILPNEETRPGRKLAFRPRQAADVVSDPGVFRRLAGVCDPSPLGCCGWRGHANRLPRHYIRRSQKLRARYCAQRVSANLLIHSLARFIGMRSPVHLAWCAEIRAVPFKKTAKTAIGYLEKVEMDALLNQPDRRTRLGARDRGESWIRAIGWWVSLNSA